MSVRLWYQKEKLPLVKLAALAKLVPPVHVALVQYLICVCVPYDSSPLGPFVLSLNYPWPGEVRPDHKGCFDVFGWAPPCLDNTAD